MLLTICSAKKYVMLDICCLLGYYAAYISNSLPTFRDNLSVPSGRVKKSKRSVTSQKSADLTHTATEG
jgi:hypothetical protein